MTVLIQVLYDVSSSAAINRLMFALVPDGDEHPWQHAHSTPGICSCGIFLITVLQDTIDVQTGGPGAGVVVGRLNIFRASDLA